MNETGAFNFWCWRDVFTKKWLSTPWSELTQSRNRMAEEVEDACRKALARLGVGDQLRASDLAGGSPLLVFRRLEKSGIDGAFPRFAVERHPLGTDLRRIVSQGIPASWDETVEGEDSSFGNLTISEEFSSLQTLWTTSEESAVDLLVEFASDFHCAEYCLLDSSDRELLPCSPIWPEEFHRLLRGRHGTF